MISFSKHPSAEIHPQIPQIHSSKAILGTSSHDQISLPDPSHSQAGRSSSRPSSSINPSQPTPPRPCSSHPPRPCLRRLFPELFQISHHAALGLFSVASTSVPPLGLHQIHTAKHHGCSLQQSPALVFFSDKPQIHRSVPGPSLPPLQQIRCFNLSTIGHCPGYSGLLQQGSPSSSFPSSHQQASLQSRLHLLFLSPLAAVLHHSRKASSSIAPLHIAAAVVPHSLPQHLLPS